MEPDCDEEEEDREERDPSARLTNSEHNRSSTVICHQSSFELYVDDQLTIALAMVQERSISSLNEMQQHTVRSLRAAIQGPQSPLEIGIGQQQQGRESKDLEGSDGDLDRTFPDLDSSSTAEVGVKPSKTSNSTVDIQKVVGKSAKVVSVVEQQSHTKAGTAVAQKLRSLAEAQREDKVNAKQPSPLGLIVGDKPKDCGSTLRTDAVLVGFPGIHLSDSEQHAWISTPAQQVDHCDTDLHTEQCSTDLHTEQHKLLAGQGQQNGTIQSKNCENTAVSVDNSSLLTVSMLSLEKESSTHFAASHRLTTVRNVPVNEDKRQQVNTVMVENTWKAAQMNEPNEHHLRHTMVLKRQPQPNKTAEIKVHKSRKKSKGQKDNSKVAKSKTHNMDAVSQQPPGRTDTIHPLIRNAKPAPSHHKNHVPQSHQQSVNMDNSKNCVPQRHQPSVNMDSSKNCVPQRHQPSVNMDSSKNCVPQSHQPSVNMDSSCCDFSCALGTRSYHKNHAANSTSVHNGRHCQLIRALQTPKHKPMPRKRPGGYLQRYIKTKSNQLARDNLVKWEKTDQEPITSGLGTVCLQNLMKDPGSVSLSSYWSAPPVHCNINPRVENLYLSHRQRFYNPTGARRPCHHLPPLGMLPHDYGHDTWTLTLLASHCPISRPRVARPSMFHHRPF